MAGDDSIEVLFDAARIAERVDTIAREIAAAEPRDLLVAVILKGSFVFAADLLRALDRAGMDARVDFITLASYGEATESSGRVVVVHDLSEAVAGRPVLLIDDILESGRTLAFARELLIGRGAARVRTCVLLDKSALRRVPIEADYVGFRIGNDYVVGYGLDLAHRFRGLPYIGTVRPGRT
jgi:hypoxanthine phosphoribosyltransferase